MQSLALVQAYCRLCVAYTSTGGASTLLVGARYRVTYKTKVNGFERKLSLSRFQTWIFSLDCMTSCVALWRGRQADLLCFGYTKLKGQNGSQLVVFYSVYLRALLAVQFQQNNFLWNLPNRVYIGIHWAEIVISICQFQSSLA